MFGLNEHQGNSLRSDSVVVKMCSSWQQRSEVANVDDDVVILKGAWPAGRCPVIGWLVGCRSGEQKTGEPENQRVSLNDGEYDNVRERSTLRLRCSRTCRSLEKLTGGLFASFARNWTLPVDLSHKVVEDLHTNTNKHEDVKNMLTVLANQDV